MSASKAQQAVLAAEEAVLEAFAMCSPRIQQRIVDCLMNAPIGTMSPKQCGQITTFTCALRRLATELSAESASTAEVGK